MEAVKSAKGKFVPDAPRPLVELQLLDRVVPAPPLSLVSELLSLLLSRLLLTSVVARLGWIAGLWWVG